MPYPGPCGIAERVPLSSDWWLKLLPSYRPWKHVDLGSCMQAAVVRKGRRLKGELWADKWQQWSSRYQHPLTVPYSHGGACHCAASSGRRAALSSRNQSLDSLKQACDFYESYTVIYENIIPAVYVAVIDLFMKTAIVLRSVRGSQTTERLQVEVIVLWTQWNRSPLTMCTTKEKHPSHWTKPLLQASKANRATTGYMLKTT